MAASSLIPSYPPIASATVPGLISTAAQAFAGLKTFSGGAVVSLPTAGVTDLVLKVGTTQAAPTGVNGFKLIRAVTGLGGTEVEHFAVKAGDATGGDYSGIVTINPAGSPTNKPGLTIGSGPGFGGMIGFGAGVSGGSNVGEYDGTMLALMTTNRQIYAFANSTAYIPAGQPHMHFLSSAAGARTRFLFEDGGTVDSGQKLMRWKVNGATVADLDGAGNFYAAGQVSAGGIVAAGTSFYAAAGGLYANGNFPLYLASAQMDGASAVAAIVNSAFQFTTAGSKLLSIQNLSAEKAFVGYDGTVELLGSGVGIVLASPNGTRYRITVTNAGAINVAAA